MKKIFLFAVVIFLMQTSFAQTKVDEFERTISDDESIRILNFLDELKEEPESKGLIVVYSGENSKSLGAVLRHIEGIKLYMSAYKLKPAEKVNFKITEGKKPLFKEFWVYRKDESLPEGDAKNLILDNLQTKYLFASVCANCSPVEITLSSSFVGFGTYTELLERYPDYKSLIVINLPYPYTGSYYKEAVFYAAEYRNILVKEHKISNKRVAIKITKSIGKKESPMITSFYIVPKAIKRL